MSDQHQRLPPADFRIDEMGRAMAQGIVAGIDWASDVHVACLLDADGAVSARFSFTHDSAAIRSMVRRLRAAGVAGVAIERGDGPVVEELLAAGLAVFVVPSRQIKGLRTRYGSAGNKDDAGGLRICPLTTSRARHVRGSKLLSLPRPAGSCFS